MALLEELILVEVEVVVEQRLYLITQLVPVVQVSLFSN